MSTRTLKLSALGFATALAGTSMTGAVLASAQAHPAHMGQAHVAKHHRRSRSHHRASGIPQRGGGDHDSDNRGGPSDGDGNV